MKANRKTWPIGVLPLKEKREVIKLTLISDGATGKQWVDLILNRGFKLEKTVRKFLRSDQFRPTAPGTVHDVTIFVCWIPSGRLQSPVEINRRIKRRKLGSLHPEVMCLLLKNYTNAQFRELGIYAVILNGEPFMDLQGNPVQIGLDCFSKNYGLAAYGAGQEDIISEAWAVACASTE